ncbi:hypothetical protein EDC18_10796 [Natranaerovirga pectinivora]|uniref:Uncharacterized protein n=1 Tax=Natranaerovirga pectinivora TaxID=682400 RepID=A0A4R3MIL8_9FIRM|nr:hypothetical protein [Natranaerovirga pectinivora]TCT14027.1 hypothetical protein EDC18_10796 [Natranaerovirga pectinivora]
MFTLYIFKKRIIINKEKSYYYCILILLLYESILEFIIGKSKEVLLKDFLKNNNKFDELVCLWSKFNKHEKEFIKKLCCENTMISEMYIDEIEKLCRFQKYQSITTKISNTESLKYDQGFHKISKSDNIAIYGVGNIGMILYKLLSKNDYSVKIFIDEFYEDKTANNMPVIKSVELSKHNYNYDVIIITPVFDFDTIYENLKKYTDKTIISIEFIL